MNKYTVETKKREKLNTKQRESGHWRNDRHGMKEETTRINTKRKVKDIASH
jgi:predicted secreted protein